MRSSSTSPVGGLRRSGHKNDPAQFVLPFLDESDWTAGNSEPDCGSFGETGEKPAPTAPCLIGALANLEPGPIQSAAQRVECKTVRSPKREEKRSTRATKKPPATLTRVELISAPANIIALVEKRSGAWSASELAELLGCTGKHIYALAKSGRLPHLRIGGMVRFDPAATAEWLRNRFIAA